MDTRPPDHRPAMALCAVRAMANKTKLEQNASQRKQFGVPLQMLQLIEDVTHGTAAAEKAISSFLLHLFCVSNFSSNLTFYFFFFFVFRGLLSP